MRRIRARWSGPSHPWQKTRIEAEREIFYAYGLKNRTEIWKANSLLKKFAESAKTLIPQKTSQAEKEKEQLLARLSRLGLMPVGSQIEEVLGLTVRDILERRLQSIVFKKGFARSMTQARQFITHEHMMVGEKKITSPSYLVSKQEEDLIAFAVSSAFIDAEHPERKPVEKTAAEKEVLAAAKKKQDAALEEEENIIVPIEDAQ